MVRIRFEWGVCIETGKGWHLGYLFYLCICLVFPSSVCKCRDSRQQTAWRPVALLVAHVRESDNIKDVRVVVVFVFEMQTPKRHDERSVGEREAFDGHPPQAN